VGRSNNTPYSLNSLLNNPVPRARKRKRTEEAFLPVSLYEGTKLSFAMAYDEQQIIE
jgi:hypothetical protein